MILTLLLGVAAGALVGRRTAPYRPAHTTVAWAERTIETRPPRSVLAWVACLAVLGALTAVWLFHPVRSAVNLRAWWDTERAPAPRRDPNRAANRGASSPASKAAAGFVPTIAVDFDKVVHAYSRGWADGTIYDPPLPGALDGLRALMAKAAVFIHTTRDPHDVAAWLTGYGLDAVADSPVPASTFWTERGRLLVTSRKYPAVVYLNDRAVRFTSWDTALDDVVLAAGSDLTPQMPTGAGRTSP